nr:uncharacterized protein LOC117989021 [Maniola hyperantus]
MANNEDVNNKMISLVSYDEEINEYILQIIQSNERFEALANVEKNVRKRAEEEINTCTLIKNTNTLIKTQLKQQKQSKESLVEPKLTIEAKNVPTMKASRTYKARDTFVLPQLSLTAMETAPISNFDQDVNVIKARESQHDLKTKNPPQDNVNDDEVMDKIDLTKKVSQDILLPPTQFLDFTLSPQEKRVTFNGVITIGDLETNGGIRQDDNVINNLHNSQLNASTASDDSYQKIKDFVFNKHNVYLSPEFTYTKNIVVPMVVENKIVTSKFFDEKKQEDNNNIDSTKSQNMEIIEIVDEEPQLKQTQEIHAETINQTNTTSDNTFEAQECDAPLAAPAFANRIRDVPCSLNISMNNTGYEDEEFPQCTDSSLLLSPKADDEMETNNNAETQPQEVHNFFSGYRRTGFSLFGTNEGDAQSQNKKFNFNFDENEKPKKSGFFSMFQ